MDLVDNIDLEAASGGLIPHVLDDLAHLVDAAVRRAVDLIDVERAALGDFHALRALVAGVGRRPALAIERLGEHAGGGRLADAPDAGEEISVRDPAAGDRVA